jgi:general secretion pathway protein D
MNGMVNLLSRRTIRSHVMALSGAMLLVACSTPIPKPSSGHIQIDEAAPRGKIPEPVQLAIPLPKPRPSAKPETYSVVVSNIRVQDLLFSLARDAKINVDVHPGIAGTVTINAIDQTMQQLLVRIAKQVDMRYELENGTLIVMPDSPFLRSYRVDYLDMTRDSQSSVSISTQIATTGGTGTGSAPAAGGGNNSLTRITNSAKNEFWKTLEQNLKDLLRETDKILPEGSFETVTEQSGLQSTSGTGASQNAPAKRSATASAQTSIAASPNPASLQASGTQMVKRSTFREAASVIASPETGIVTVRATARQHEKVQEFLDQVMAGARRQVLIEVTVAEVQLNQNYQQGINWQRLAQSGNGFGLSQLPAGNPAPSGTPAQSLFLLNYLNPTSRIGNISATLSLLESFGNVKVLSSPKISVINNQTALLKVVDNKVYFTIKADVIQNQTTTVTTYTTTLNSVPIGFVMQVTPQISEDDTILLNVRPTVSRITGYVNDPNPDLAKANVTSRIPEIQSREMESVLRIPSGQIAVMGGLMQDSINNNTDTIPGAASLPLFGNLFQNRNETATKTELVIFLRPQVIRDASIDGDFRGMKNQLPDREFLKKQIGPRSLSLTSGSGEN